ncbi:tetratricopeptide repeat protein [Dechloromonas sp. ZY10]|uniref:tetratricopeptide repeat protein n=1 Tax=Dechloromonas aquae TaxID=2664436 RepID=UPI0035293103
MIGSGSIAMPWRHALLLTAAGMTCGAASVAYFGDELPTSMPPPTWPTQAAPTLTLPALPLATPAQPLSQPETVEAPEPPRPRPAPTNLEARLQQHWEGVRQTLRQHDLDTAREMLETLLREYPGHAPSLRALALLDSAQGATDRARERHRQANHGTGETPESQAIGWLAENTRGSARMLQLLGTLYPDSPTLHFAEGVAHGEEADWKTAAQAFEKSLRRATDAPDTWYNLAVAKDHQGQPKAAAAAYQEALRQAQTHPHRFPLEQARQRLTALASGGMR